MKNGRLRRLMRINFHSFEALQNDISTNERSDGETIKAAVEAPGFPGCLVVRLSSRASKRQRRKRPRYRQIRLETAMVSHVTMWQSRR